MAGRAIVISQEERDKVTQLRIAVGAYREVHRLLHAVPWHKGVPDEHTPLLLKLKEDLVKLGYKEEIALKDAFADSELLNVKELGFTDMADFNARANEVDIIAFEEKWS